MYKISIGGKAKAGKNTVANLLLKNLYLDDKNSKINAFANPIKQMVEIMFPNANKECLYGESELRSNIIDERYLDANGNPITYRQPLMDIGKLGRSYNPDIWVNCIVDDIIKVENSKNCKAYIISDQRFPNEFDLLKSLGFYMIRVKREDAAVINDVSETSQDLIHDSKFDFVIDNNKTMEYLNNQILTIVSKLTSGIF